MDLQLILYSWSSNLVNPFKLKTAGGRRGKCRPMTGGHVTGESRQEVRLVKRQLLPHPRAHSNHEAPTFTGLPPPPVLVHHSPCFRILFLSFTEVGPTTPLPHRQRKRAHRWQHPLLPVPGESPSAPPVLAAEARSSHWRQNPRWITMTRRTLNYSNRHFNTVRLRLERLVTRGSVIQEIGKYLTEALRGPQSHKFKVLGSQSA